MKFKNLIFVGSMALMGTMPVNTAQAHPHVFVEANMDIVLNDEGKFTELRYVWRFDEVFSTTIQFDYDANGNGKMDDDETQEISNTVKKSIAEYDFYTAIRSGGKALQFYEPEEIKTYFEDGQMIMILAIQPEVPYDFAKGPLRLSASDTSYYVAFDFSSENVVIEGNSKGCQKEVVHPNFDDLYADDTLTESFFDQPNNQLLDDEFYSWAVVTCG